jgi:alpha-D-ribose 1-methylphosphonate 5-triphosphate synthase subunit PhnL
MIKMDKANGLGQINLRQDDLHIDRVALPTIRVIRVRVVACGFESRFTCMRIY